MSHLSISAHLLYESAMLKGESHVATEQTRASCWNYHLLASWSPILSLLAIMTQASDEHSGQNLLIQGNYHEHHPRGAL
jgi:hypothetical protein